jgi:hypothetical protein
VRRATHELDLLAKSRGAVAEPGGGLVAVESLDDLVAASPALFGRLVHVDAVLEQVVDAPQLATHADGPRDRRAGDAQHFLDFVEQVGRFAALAVELVDERDDRRVAQPAHFHQLDRALLHALGAVDDHQRGVDRRQCAVRVLGKILVPRRVEQIHDPSVVRELHDAGRDRDAPLLLEAHPVGGRMARGLASFHGAGELDRAAEQQQLFGERGLAGVGVRDDGEGAATRDFVEGLIHPAYVTGNDSFRTNASSRPSVAW